MRVILTLANSLKDRYNDHDQNSNSQDLQGDLRVGFLTN